MCFSRCARETAKKKQAQKRLPYSQLFQTSGQKPTVACLPLRTMGVFSSLGSSSSFSSLSSS